MNGKIKKFILWEKYSHKIIFIYSEKLIFCYFLALFLHTQK